LLPLERLGLQAVSFFPLLTNQVQKREIKLERGVLRKLAHLVGKKLEDLVYVAAAGRELDERTVSENGGYLQPWYDRRRNLDSGEDFRMKQIPGIGLLVLRQAGVGWRGHTGCAAHGGFVEANRGIALLLISDAVGQTLGCEDFHDVASSLFKCALIT